MTRCTESSGGMESRMINLFEVAETNEMIARENLDVRTITLGISLLDCIDADLSKVNEKVYHKITTVARDLVKTGDAIEKEFGIPIVNKRISVTPMALIGSAACQSKEDFVALTYEKTLQIAEHIAPYIAPVKEPVSAARFDMLIYQGIASYEIWHDITIDKKSAVDIKNVLSDFFLNGGGDK